MKTGRILVIVTAGMLATGYWLLGEGQAQTHSGGLNVVAVVNIPQVFAQSKEISALTNEFKKAQDQLEAEARTRQQAIQKMQEALKGFAPGSKDYQDRERELLNATINRQVWLEQSQQAMIIQHQKLTEAFYQKVLAKIEQLATENQFHLVLYKEDHQIKDARSPQEQLEMIRQRKVLYCSPRTDLTAKVIERLDADYAGQVPGGAPR